MKLSQRIQSVAPSATLAVTARAKQLKAEGVDILAMAAGEPDFDTPANIKRAAVAAIEAGATKYTPVPGTPELRRAVADRTAETYGRAFTTDQVIVSAGGKQVLFNACAALLDAGDEAVFAAPYWVSYPDMVRFNGAEPVAVWGDHRAGGLPDAATLERAFTGNTRLLILNSPSNPTGAVYTRDDLEAIAEMLRRHPEVFIITDDVYEALVFDGAFVSIAHLAEDLSDRVLIASAVSKTYAMTGWRVGYGIGPKELIAAMSRLQGASTSGACSIAQAAATEALRGDQTAIGEMRAIFRQRRDRLLTGLREIPGVEVATPGGAFYAFVNIDHYLGGKVANTTDLCKHLLEATGLAAVPGVAFGSERHIRLSFACGEPEIDEGVRRLRTGLGELK